MLAVVVFELRFPNDLARLCDARSAVSAEVQVDAITFDHGRWRSKTILRVQQLRRLRLKQFDVLLNRAGVYVDGDGAQRAPIFSRGREPDAIALDYWRGPAATGNRSFPAHVLCFAPR